ncbi:Uncharacterised protein [Chryseobacterium gleum]|uniref:Uncharacterized protein n=2 Tax=Chryseobacterium gleum TaxID=250 RepID=A0A3S4MFJ0_CHRGE|nr:Uncharacterised protein [Chryseobacterium gleum]
MIHRSKKLRIRSISLSPLETEMRAKEMEIYKKRLVKEIIDEIPIEFLDKMFSITIDEDDHVTEIKSEIFLDDFIDHHLPKIVVGKNIYPAKK